MSVRSGRRAKPQAHVPKPLLANIHAAAAALLVVNSIVLKVVNERVPASYMDEPFHVGQTQKYCAGQFREWDPKITTFPGLYIVGTATAWLQHAAQKLTGHNVDMDAFCNTASLRAVNVQLSVICLYVLYAVICALRQPAGKQQQPQTKASTVAQPHGDAAAVAWALALTLLPLHWFYVYLYYTDVGSTLCLLLCYLACLKQRPLAALLASIAAVLFRQTNAVWVVFIMGATVLRLLQQSGLAAPVGASLTAELSTTLRGMLRLLPKILVQLGPVSLVPAAFIAFLVVNGGVTVGDREAHAPVKHWAQLVYFAPYAAAMLAVQLLPAARHAAKAVGARPVTAVLVLAALVVAAVAALWASPPPHPYLLADNRHYTFYLWRKVINRSPVMRLAAVAPASALSWGLLLLGLLRTQQKLWVLGWAASTFVVLVPAWLLEFRYYTVPLLIAALHLPLPSTRQSLVCLAGFAVVNAATLYLFLMSPFTWADGTQARFMW